VLSFSSLAPSVSAVSTPLFPFPSSSFLPRSPLSPLFPYTTLFRQMVPLRLVEDALPDGVLQFPAVEAPEGNLLPAVETALQPAVRRHPDPAAGPAEVAAHRGDEPHSAFGTGQLVPPGHPLGLDGLQLRHPVQHRSGGQEAAFVPPGAGTHGHQLDEPHLPGMLPAQVHEISDLVVVEAADEDGVEFQI